MPSSKTEPATTAKITAMSQTPKSGTAATGQNAVAAMMQQSSRKAISERLAKYGEVERQLKAKAFQTSSKTLKDSYSAVFKDLNDMYKQLTAGEQSAESRRDSERLAEQLEQMKEELSKTKAERLAEIGDGEIKKMIADFKTEVDMNRVIIHEKATENERLQAKISELERRRDEQTIELEVNKREIERLQVELATAKEKCNEKLIDDLKNQMNETLSEKEHAESGGQGALIEELKSEFSAKFEGLEKILGELKKDLNRQANAPDKGNSWATIASRGKEKRPTELAPSTTSNARPAAQSKRAEPVKRFSACVSSKEKNMLNSEAITKKIRELKKHGSTYVRTVDNNRLYVNSASESEIDQIVKGLEPMPNIEARKLVDRSPRVFVKFIDKNVDKSEYIENIILSNPEKQIPREKIRFIYEINKMEMDHKMAVFAVDQDYIAEFTAFRRIKIGQTSCRIDEYRRAGEYCFHCSRPGHRASVNGQLVCTNEPACPICAGPHGKQGCTSRGVPKCANCTREGAEESACMHPAHSEFCPTLKKIGKKRRSTRNG